MKYEHNEVHDKTVGEIVVSNYHCMHPKEVECNLCPFGNLGESCDIKINGSGKKSRVIEYIAEEVAQVWREDELFITHLNEWNDFCDKNEIDFKDKYPVDSQTAKEIADAARVLLEGGEAKEKITPLGIQIAARMCPDCHTMIPLDDPICFTCGHNFPAQPEENYIADILDGNRPTTADAFYVYNGDLEKCITVSREQGDDIIDLTIHNEMDIATARVFCEKLSSFLRGL